MKSWIEMTSGAETEAVPLLFQVIIGAVMFCVMSSFQAVLIDLHPGRSASAAASVRSSRR